MKKTFLLICALLVSSVIPALAENMFMLDELAYNKLGGDSVEVISLQEYYGDNYGYVTYSGSIEIPETIYYDGMQYRVTAIGEMAFGTSRDMTSVTIPNTVTSIGSYAFSDCEGLTTITIPNSVTTIESWAFQVCTNVKTLTIGDGLSVINQSAFSGCSSLTKVVLGKNVTTIKTGAFSECINLSDINIPASVTSISQDAFYNCPLKYAIYDNALYLGNTDNPYYILIKPTDTSIISCKIHDDTRVINEWAFYGCSNLTTIVMGQSVTTIGSAAFSGCTNLQYNTLDNAKYLGSESNPNYALITLEGDLTSFTIPKTVMVVQNDASFANLEELQVEVGNPIYHSAGNCLIATASSTLVKGCKNSSIPTDIITIGENAFFECSGLTSVTIPESVCTIGHEAFHNCSGLTSITLSESVKSIGDYAFCNCSKLTSITIPNSVISIGESAFAFCSKLTSAIIGAKVTPSTHGIVIGRDAFYGCANMTSLTLCEGVSTISYLAFGSCSSIESITIPNTVTRLLNGAFHKCSSITSIVIPESVTEFGGDLFYGCSNLTSIEWNVKYRGAHCFPYPFSGCNNVTSFTFGDNVEYIPNELCNGMSKVTSIYLPSGVKAIGRYAFNGTGITQIDIPYEVHEIGDGAFDCPNLEYARFSGMAPWIGSNVFNSNTIVYIPCGMLADYEYSNFSGYNLQEEKMFDFNWSAESADEKKGSVEIIQDISCYDNTVIFEAIPASGYQFKEWNDGNTENPRTAEIICDTVFTAEFSPESIMVIGDKFAVNGINYAYLGGDSVEVTKGDNYKGSITVPATIDYNETSYRVTAIGWGAFGRYSDLKSVTILEGVKEIKSFAFYNSSSLQTINIPNSIIKIAGSVFSGCSGLTSPVYNNKLFACFPLSSSGAYTIPDGIEIIVSGAFNQRHNLTSIVIPNSVITIEEYAFFSCEGLVSATIGNSVITIGESAFQGCTNLSSINFPESVTEVGGVAFASCPKLTEPLYNQHVFAYMPSSYIGDYTIQDGIKLISGSALSGCSGLSSITIPSSVTSIDDYAFYWCTNLTEITCEAIIPPTIGGSQTFEEVNRTLPLYVPAESVEAYQTANYWKQFTNIQAIPETSITTLNLRVDKIALYPNEKYFLNTVIAPAEVDKNTLIWTSSDVDIATVDSTGFVTAHTVGTANIIVSTSDYTLSDTCEVVVLDESQEPSDDVVVDPNDKSVNITWTPVEGAAYYVFVVYADETQVTKICTLTFNAWGFLTNIHFLPKKPALTPENNPFNFTVTGLEENTTYGYSMSSYNEDETLITSKAGQFTTTSNVTTGVETPYIASPNKVRKVLENGTIYILRNDEKYTIDGRKMK